MCCSSFRPWALVLASLAWLWGVGPWMTPMGKDTHGKDTWHNSTVFLALRRHLQNSIQTMIFKYMTQIWFMLWKMGCKKIASITWFTRSQWQVLMTWPDNEHLRKAKGTTDTAEEVSQHEFSGKMPVINHSILPTSCCVLGKSLKSYVQNSFEGNWQLE